MLLAMDKVGEPRNSYSSAQEFLELCKLYDLVCQERLANGGPRSGALCAVGIADLDSAGANSHRKMASCQAEDGNGG